MIDKPNFFQRLFNVDKAQPTKADVATKIVKRQLIRQQQDVKKWRDATTTAERNDDGIAPDRTELIRLYNDVVLDAHLASTMDTVVLKCLSAKFVLQDADGVTDDEETKKLQKAWFRDFITFTIESKFWGFSLVQLGAIKDDEFNEIKLVPRENVVPELGLVKKEVFVNPFRGARQSKNGENFVKYEDPQFSPWVIPIGKANDLGLIHKAAPWVLWKKNVTIAWSQYAELFGMPVRVGKTDIRDPEKLKNMDAMLSDMGTAAYGIFDPDDELEFIEAKVGDSWHVYDMFIERANSEVSKLIQGQTMTTEDGSSRSQGEVHERQFNERLAALKWFIRDTVQTKLLPRMEKHGIIKPGLTFAFDSEEKLTTAEKLNMVVQLSAIYKIPEQYIIDNFNIPVEEKAPEQPFSALSNRSKATTIMAEVANLYKGHNPDKHKHEPGEKC